ncbi:MAG: GNAT family N-acetyltransferase [Actinomycetota bacterium]|nr:GNAT family N-acetyltransferase [Actinomycetota bacterium]
MTLPPDLDMRELVPGDVDALVELMSRCHATYREWAPAGWEPPDAVQEQPKILERLADPDRWARGAFDAEDRLVATIIWEQFKDSETGAAPAVAHVSAVFVDPARWRQGIATVLLSQAEETMRERGYHLARLWTPERAPARRFYEAHGWRQDGRRMWHDRFHLHHMGYEKRLVPQRRPAHGS